MPTPDDQRFSVWNSVDRQAGPGLSETCLKSEYTQPEWAAAFAPDPTGKKRKLIPVRVAECALAGMLVPIVHIDLIGLDEPDAKRALLDGLKPSGKPAQPPRFPGKRAALVKNELPFDGPGRILLTTRDAATATVTGAVKVKKMEPEESARFLLRRAGLIGRDSGRESASGDQQAAARELSIKLDGLPLALDHAGAFIGAW